VRRGPKQGGAVTFNTFALQTCKALRDSGYSDNEVDSLYNENEMRLLRMWSFGWRPFEAAEKIGRVLVLKGAFEV